MTESTLSQQYQMLLRFSYGDRNKLILELEDLIKMYSSSANSNSEKCQKRISFYESVLKLAIDDSRSIQQIGNSP